MLSPFRSPSDAVARGRGYPWTIPRRAGARARRARAGGFPYAVFEFVVRVVLTVISGALPLERATHRYTRALHTTQGHHLIANIGNARAPNSDGRQQLAVKAAGGFAEDLPLDWVHVDLQGLALQGQHEDAPAL